MLVPRRLRPRRRKSWQVIAGAAASRISDDIEVRKCGIGALRNSHGGRVFEMITKYITACTTRFNPFHASAKPCRVFLALFPPGAWGKVKIKNELLPQASKEPGSLSVTFTDGKNMTFDTEKLKIGDILEEVKRHSRQLNRKAELAG